MEFFEAVTQALSAACTKAGYEIHSDDVRKSLSWAKKGFGDIASTVTFDLAKTHKQKPVEVADKILKELVIDKSIFENVDTMGPYINFYFSNHHLLTALHEIVDKGEKFGSVNIGKGKIVLVEFSQPNPGKPMHIGHIRSTVMGDALRNILIFAGYKALGLNLINDIGAHIAKLILAMRTFEDLPEVKTEKDLLQYYVRANNAVEGSQELADQAKEILRLLESGDQSVTADLKRIVDMSMEAFNRNYNLLNIKFDEFIFETNFVKNSLSIVKEMEKKNLIFKDKDGRLIADLEKHGIPNTVILRSNGTTMYLTRDLAITDYKYKKYAFDVSLYLTDMRQNLHFRQHFKILELLGRGYSNNCIHLGFGAISSVDGIMSTRSGNVLYLEDILNKAIDASKDEIRETQKQIYSEGDIDEIAKSVGIGAAKFTMLKVSPEKNVLFDFKKMVSFKGATSAYLQYSNVRANKILSKGKLLPAISLKYQLNESEKKLVKKLAQFPETIAKSAKDYQSYYVADYLLDVADLFNRFYENSPVIKASDTERGTRAAIVSSTAIVLKTGLQLLGIGVPEKM